MPKGVNVDPFLRAMILAALSRSAWSLATSPASSSTIAASRSSSSVRSRFSLWARSVSALASVSRPAIS